MVGSGDDTALIIPVSLPAPLETLRRRTVSEARVGLPAHATLLYPFVPAGSLDDRARASIAAITARHAAFAFVLRELREWPGTLYASLEPEDPFLRLQAELASAFPAYPLYGAAFPFVPHVTVMAGAAIDFKAAMGQDAAVRASVPAHRVARTVVVMVREASRWERRWLCPLG